MMNTAQNLGALANITEVSQMMTESETPEGIMQASFGDLGYPNNLPDEDKAYILKRLMDFANEDFNPWTQGSTGFPLLMKEKYGIGSK